MSIALIIAHLGHLEKSESWKFVSEKGYEPWTYWSPIQSNNTSDYQNKEVWCGLSRVRSPDFYQIGRLKVVIPVDQFCTKVREKTFW